jgi:hypothetical protein
VEDFFRWRKAYQNYGRGKRDENGRQTHLMNKVLNARHLREFVKYVQLTDIFSSENGDLRIRTNGALRIAANIAHQKLEGLGFKKIAKLLGVDPETCRYWTLKNPLSDRDFEKKEVGQILFGLLDEFEKGVVSESVDPTDSLTTPQEMSLTLRVYLWWVSEYQAKPTVQAGPPINTSLPLTNVQGHRLPHAIKEPILTWTLDKGGVG